MIVGDLDALLRHQVVIHPVCRLTAGPELEVDECPDEWDLVLIRLLHEVNRTDAVGTKNTVKGVTVKVWVSARRVSTVDVDAGDGVVESSNVLLVDFL